MIFVILVWGVMTIATTTLVALITTLIERQHERERIPPMYVKKEG